MAPRSPVRLRRWAAPVAVTAGLLVVLLPGCSGPAVRPAAAPVTSSQPSPAQPVAAGQTAAPAAVDPPAEPPGQVAPVGTAPVEAAPVTAGPAPAAAPMPRSVPLRLQIPSIGVDTALEPLGLLADGTLQLPTQGFPAGWYTGAPTPGERGPAVLAGHVDWGGRAGVFSRLRAVAVGDRVSVTRQDGTVAVFRVTLVRQIAKNTFPTDEVYGNLDHSGLRLITCGGAFDRSSHHYVDNVLVFADLVAAGS